MQITFGKNTIYWRKPTRIHLDDNVYHCTLCCTPDFAWLRVHLLGSKDYNNLQASKSFLSHFIDEEYIQLLYDHSKYTSFPMMPLNLLKLILNKRTTYFKINDDIGFIRTSTKKGILLCDGFFHNITINLLLKLIDLITERQYISSLSIYIKHYYFSHSVIVLDDDIKIGCQLITSDDISKFKKYLESGHPTKT